ncbi:MAG: hypothetical protein V3T05_00440 [Myxococcota bacterium]
MVDVKNLPPPNFVPPVSQKTSPAGPTEALDPTLRAALTQPATVGAPLPAPEAPASAMQLPPIPETNVNPETLNAANSFVSQLVDMGANATNPDQLLANFLKLQILGATIDLTDQYLAGEGMSALRQNAYNMAKESYLAQAESLRSQADSHEQEIDRLYETVQAEDRQPTMQELQQAEALHEAAGKKRDKAGAIVHGHIDALVVTATVRKGTDNEKSKLRNQEYLYDVQKLFGQILGRERPDRILLSDTIRELEESRHVVTELLRAMIDRNQLANANQTRYAPS